MSIALTMDMLFALQKIDDELRNVDARRSTNRKAAETEGVKLTRALAWVEAAGVEMKSRRLREAGAEKKIASLREKVEKLDQKIYSVKNIKELKAIEAEQAKLAADVSTHEDQLLEILEDIEDLGNKIEFAEAEIAKMRDKLEVRKAEAESFEADVTEKIARLYFNREKLCSIIDFQTLMAYDEIRKRHAGTGIMAMIDEICPKCSFGIPKSVMTSVLSSDSPGSCRECGMLLFWPHPLDKRNCGDCSRIVDPEELAEVFSRGEPFTCDRCGKIHDPVGFGEPGFDGD